MIYRHKKTGNKYTIVCQAMMQDSTHKVLDDAIVIVYKNQDDMKFVRPINEFNEKFELINE